MAEILIFSVMVASTRMTDSDNGVFIIVDDDDNHRAISMEATTVTLASTAIR